MRKRYWLFTWENYYPATGTRQVQLKFDSIEEVESWLIENDERFDDGAEVLDLDEGVTYRSNGEVDGSELMNEWLRSLPLKIY